jgi:hypothetical protein
MYLDVGRMPLIQKIKNHQGNWLLRFFKDRYNFYEYCTFYFINK